MAQLLVRKVDEDLVARAKVSLLRLDQSALADGGSAPPRSGARGGKAGWLRVRVYEKGGSRPKVLINLPMGLAELAFKSLPDSATRSLREKGYDAENFWQQLMKLGPTEVLTVEEEDGSKVQIWIE